MEDVCVSASPASQINQVEVLQNEVACCGVQEEALGRSWLRLAFHDGDRCGLCLSALLHGISVHTG